MLALEIEATACYAMTPTVALANLPSITPIHGTAPAPLIMEMMVTSTPTLESWFAMISTIQAHPGHEDGKASTAGIIAPILTTTLISGHSTLILALT